MWYWVQSMNPSFLHHKKKHNVIDGSQASSTAHQSRQALCEAGGLRWPERAAAVHQGDGDAVDGYIVTETMD